MVRPSRPVACRLPASCRQVAPPQKPAAHPRSRLPHSESRLPHQLLAGCPPVAGCLPVHAGSPVAHRLPASCTGPAGCEPAARRLPASCLPAAAEHVATATAAAVWALITRATKAVKSEARPEFEGPLRHSASDAFVLLAKTRVRHSLHQKNRQTKINHYAKHDWAPDASSLPLCAPGHANAKPTGPYTGATPTKP